MEARLSPQQTIALSATEHDDDGAAAAVAEMRLWVERHGLAELPPEHAALREHPFGLFLELEHLRAGWHRVFLSQHTAMGLGTWVTWDDDDGGGGAFVPPGVSWALSPVLHRLMRRLPGDAIELRYALAGRMPIMPRGTWVHPDGWWDEWKSRQLAHGKPTLGDVYRSFLYPRVLGVLDRLGGEVGAVVDVCAGDGELGELVLGHLTHARLTLLERNHAACVQARARLSGRGEVLQGDASHRDAWQDLGPFDVALLVGAVQNNVMSAGAAVTVMEQVHRTLAVGGHAVVLGWSACLLDREGFEALGFTVLNTAQPPAGDDPNPRQLYILRKD